jgi:WD40 repeat protein
MAHSSYALDLLFTPDSGTLISAGMDNVIKLWSVPDWKLTHVFEGHANSVNSLALSPDGQTLASGSTDASVKLWFLPESRVLADLRDRKKTVACVRYSPDGERLTAGWYGGRAVVWTASGEEVVGIKAGQENLSAVTFVQTGETAGQAARKTLATAGLGGDIALWALPDGKQLFKLSGHQTAVVSMASIDGGRTLVSLGYEGTIRFWDVSSGQVVRTHAVEGPRARGLALSPDERTVAIGQEGQVRVRSVDDWATLAELPVGTRAVNGMAFSPDGHWLAVGAADGRIRVWELE